MAVRQGIEHALTVRRARPGTLNAKVEKVTKAVGRRVWSRLKRHPSVGVAAAATAGTALAMATGVGELAVGLLAGYGMYQVLREGVSARQAAQDVVEEIEGLH